VPGSMSPTASIPNPLRPSIWIFHGCCGSAAACLLDRFQILQLQKGFVLPEKYLVPPPVKKGLHGGGFDQHPRNGLARFSLASKCCREIEEEVIHIQAKPLFFHKRFQTNNRGPDVVRWAARCG
jgi:hypothetical protein